MRRAHGSASRTTNSPSGSISPGRVDVESSRVDVESGRVDVELERPASSDDVLDESRSSDVVVLTPATPRKPVSIEGGRGRPPIRTRDDSTRLETPEDDLTRRQSTQLDQVDFTQDERAGDDDEEFPNW